MWSRRTRDGEADAYKLLSVNACHSKHTITYRPTRGTVHYDVLVQLRSAEALDVS